MCLKHTMRIFLALHPSGNLSVPGSMTWYHNLYEPLIDLGYDVVLLRLDEFAQRHKISFRGKKFNEILSNELKQIFKKEQLSKPFDLFFSYLTDQDINPYAIQDLKSFGVPMANFSCNNTHQFYLVNNISPFFDFNLHSEKDAEIKFKEIEANPVWFPMAANPNYYFPLKIDFEYDASFVGSAYAKRPYYIDHLVRRGIKIDCFGPNWLINKPLNKLKKIKKEAERFKWLLESNFAFSTQKRLNLSSRVYQYDLLNNLRKLCEGRFHYPVDDIEMIRIFNSSKINLGFLEVFDEANSQVVKQHLHLREFEVPMCRGLYMTNFSEELAEFYEPEKEMVMFYSEHDMLDKANFILNHPEYADGVRNKGYLRSTSCHTYQKRFLDLFNKLAF